MPPALWKALGRPGARLLMLDYDGTLAPFRIERDRATPFPGIRSWLRRIAALPDHAVAIVSGRRLAELVRLVGPLPALLVGEHGWELRTARGTVRRSRLPAAAAVGLARAAARADELGFGDRLERKRAAVVLHVRGLTPARGRRLIRRATAAWSPIAEAGGLRLDAISGGLELRALGHDKGRVVRALIARAPRSALAVYVGDDLTDEDAFAVLSRRGFGLRVGRRHRATAAHGALRSPEAVCAFLAAWWRHARANGAGRPVSPGRARRRIGLPSHRSAPVAGAAPRPRVIR